MSVSATDRQTTVLAPAEDYLEVGFNYRMTDLQAAIGLVQLGKLPAIVARRRELAAAYADALADIDVLRPVADPPWGASNFQSYWVEVLATASLDRDGVLQALADAGISARRGIMAANRQPAYRGRDTGIVPLPATERLTDRTLILPLFHQMTDAEQSRVLDALRSAVTGRNTGRSRGAA
jgi:dTDP-4-amino-4,6-dideoxygalactose transaminase